MKVIIEAPINSLSFGNVTYNLLRQFWRRGVDVIWYPLGGNADFKSFDQIEKPFADWLNQARSSANKKIDPNIPTLKMWHLNGSQARISKNQLLYTFYELDEPTESEVNLANFQDKIIFSSKYASDKFKDKGVNCDNIPIGLDEDFKKLDKQFLNPDIIHFGLMGKFEKRKHTERILKLWLSKYGNNNKYQLSVCVTNPFFKPEEMQGVLQEAMGGKHYTNVNFLPFLEKNSQFNELLNAIDIDLTGLSGAEGWNLPAFNATCLGKWSIVLNETSHKDWANKDNCILVNSLGKEPCYDGKFFVQGGEFNQGNIYFWDRDVVSQAMDDAVSKKGQINTAGEKLKDEFSYEKTVDRIITELEAIS